MSAMPLIRVQNDLPQTAIKLSAGIPITGFYRQDGAQDPPRVPGSHFPAAGELL